MYEYSEIIWVKNRDIEKNKSDDSDFPKNIKQGCIWKVLYAELCFVPTLPNSLL